MPGGLVPGAGAVFGTVGAKAKESADVSDSSECEGDVVAGMDPRDHEALTAWTVRAAAVTNPKAANQPMRERLFEIFFGFMASPKVELNESRPSVSRYVGDI
jgi:hypothetical protein